MVSLQFPGPVVGAPLYVLPALVSAETPSRKEATTTRIRDAPIVERITPGTQPLLFVFVLFALN